MADHVRLDEAVARAMRSLTTHAIGEGPNGIVFALPGFEDVCGKYHKLRYAPHEYAMLVRAHELGCRVPAPMGELPPRRVFLMEHVHGFSIARLLREERQFAPAVVEGLMDAVRGFDRFFAHGDFKPTQLMIEGAEIREGVVVAGTPFIVGLHHACPGVSEAWQDVRGWFAGRIA